MSDRALGELDPFAIAVRTTGTFCRAGCPARTPHRQNVLFLDTIAGAREAGFRACKRCRPDAGNLSPWRAQRQLVNTGQITDEAHA